MLKNNFLNVVGLSAICTTIFIGCGGGSSVSSGLGNISGKVSGSFYEGAKVCFDANANGSCDIGEAFTTSAADGSFTLTGNSSYDVVAEIPSGAIKHEVLNDGGTVVTTPIAFIAPVSGKNSAGEITVSAISTKVWTAMKENNETLAQAKVSVAATISGIDASELLEDFNESNTLTDAQKEALQAKADAETTNIENSMIGSTLNLTLLQTNLTEDVVASTALNSNISGLSTPSQVDAIDASN